MSSGSTSAVRQGRAFVELFTDDTKLKQGLRLAENTVRKFGASVSRMGLGLMGASAAILAPLGLAVREYAKAGSALQEMSERTGIAVETLSELKYVASQTGASMQDLEKGIRMSQKVMGSALGAKALAGLGIDIAKLKALSPEESFIALAEHISRIPIQADRAAAAMKLFGRGGASLLPFLAEGRAGIARLREEARKLGLTMTGEDAAAAHAFDDSLQRVRQQVMRLVGSVGASLVPTLEQFGQWLSRAIPQVRGFVDENRGWIVVAAQAALYSAGLGIALWSLGKAALLVSGIFAAMRVAVSVVAGLWAVLTSGATVIAVIKGALLGLQAAMISAKAAVLGLATAGGLAQAVIAVWPAIFIAALGALLYFTGGFQEMGVVVKQVMGGMSDAIAAGDIELAMKIMWAGIRLIWTEGVNWVLNIFSSMGIGLQQALAYVAGGLLVGVMALTQGIHWLWTEMWTRVLNGWTATWAAMQIKFAKAKNAIGLMSDEEMTLKINEITQKKDTKIAERQAIRAQEHAKDQARTDDAVATMNNGVDNLQKELNTIFATRDAEFKKRKDEINALTAEAKAKKESMKVNPEQGPAPRGQMQPDILGGAARADAVVGGFDIGALMSFQAGDSGDKLGRIASASERTADATEAMAESDMEPSYTG